MSGSSKFWTRSWNPIVGCSRDDCRANCWAERFAHRMAHNPATAVHYQDVVTPDGKWTGRVSVSMPTLDAPRHWRAPQVVATCWMGDMFSRNVPLGYIRDVQAVMRDCPQHVFLVLTKKAERLHMIDGWPDNCFVGVSVCDQPDADARITVLLDTPAAHRWLIVEPCLGPVDLLGAIQRGYGRRSALDSLGHIDGLGFGIDWVVCGAETGPGARPCDPEWIRSIVRQCRAAGVPCWTKAGLPEGDPCFSRELPWRMP